MPAQLYYKAQKIRALTRQQVLAALEKVDVLVLPSSSEPAPLLPKEAGEEKMRHDSACPAGAVSPGCSIARTCRRSQCRVGSYW
jgi:Asp-tRNA(Asn)/Glu-tRNA(Gln) amidotransferase A subunit family amidase